MVLSVKNKTALVCGASQGAGLELAMQLAAGGAHVVILARSESKLQRGVEELKKRANNPGQTLDYVAGDMSNYKECEEVFQEVVKKLDGIPDMLFCCVGSSVPKLFTELSGEELALGVATNYLALLYMTHIMMRTVARSGGPAKDRPLRRIVLFSSILAHFTFIGYAQYLPLKAALKNLVDAIADEASFYNIKVTGVYPGNFLLEGFHEEQKTKPAITRKIEGPSEAILAEECCRKILLQLDQGHEVVTTDFVGLLLSMAAWRRQFSLDWIVSVFVGAFFLIISPFARWFMARDIHLEMTKSETKKRDVIIS